MMMMMMMMMMERGYLGVAFFIYYIICLFGRAGESIIEHGLYYLQQVNLQRPTTFNSSLTIRSLVGENQVPLACWLSHSTTILILGNCVFSCATYLPHKLARRSEPLRFATTERFSSLVCVCRRHFFVDPYPRRRVIIFIHFFLSVEV
jgi:hypothetical protein